MNLYSAYLVKLPLALFYQIMPHLVALRAVLGVLVGAAGVIITAMCLSWSSVSWAQDSTYSDSQSDNSYIYHYLMVTGDDDKLIISSAAQNDKVIGRTELTSEELKKINDNLEEYGKLRAIIHYVGIENVSQAVGFVTVSEDAPSSGHMFEFEVEEDIESFSSGSDGPSLYFVFWTYEFSPGE